MKKINFIIVGYNEQKNLPKFFSSLNNIKDILDIKVFYIDQSSDDDSVKIAKENGAEVYIHSNKGYADPDKKWAVETLVKDHEICFILDADEEISKDLALEIDETDFNIGLIPLNIYFLNKIVNTVYQTRIFKKEYIKLTEEIHNYLHVKNKKDIKSFSNFIKNIDLKNSSNEIFNLVNKTNKYTDIEKVNTGKIKTVFMMIVMPIIWFFGWGIKNKNFLRGTPGFMHAVLMGYYQFLKYAKHYERKFIEKK